MTQQLFDSLVLILGEPLEIINVAEDNVVGFWQPINDRTIDDCVYGNRRGCFDHVCINRITANIEFMHVYMFQHAIVVPQFYKTRLYLRSEYFKADQYSAIVDELLWIAERCYVTNDPPRKVPELTALLYTDINDLEGIIIAAKGFVDRINLSYIYSGEVSCGEV